MGDHLVLYVDHLITPATLESMQAPEVLESSGEGSCSHGAGFSDSSQSFEQSDDGKSVREYAVCEEEEPFIRMVECRICQEEDHIKSLETPCACSGSLKFAHRKCVQRWCNEKGDITCEICHQPYKPGYTAPSIAHSDDTTIDISGGWTISAGTPLDLHDPRLWAIAAAEHHFLQDEDDENAATNVTGASLCRSAALILLALLFLRHALTTRNGDGDENPSVFLSLFILRAAGFLFPCYIMAWAISILQRRRQRQEAAAEIAFILQSRLQRGLQFTIAPGPMASLHQEPLQ